MKKILALILAILMLTACFVGCNTTPDDPVDSDSESDTPNESETPNETDPVDSTPNDPFEESADMLQVGFGKVCITPDGSYAVPLAGSGDGKQRMTTDVKDDIYATAVVFKDKNGKMAVIVSIDILHLTTEDNQLYDRIMRYLTRIEGIDESNVILSATHTHSSVDLTSTTTAEVKSKYISFFCKAVNEAVEAAIADLAPAEIYIGKAEMKNMAFVRRYFAADGSFVGTQWPNSEAPVKHETEADTDMQLVKVVRNGKRDLVLTNWGVHLTMVQENKMISADFVSYFRDWMDKNADTDVVFFQGASGNTTPTSRLEGEGYTDDPDDYGKLLAQKLHNAMRKDGTLTKMDSCVEIKTVNDTLDLKYNHAKLEGLSDATINKAIEIAENFYSANITAAEANAQARELGFSSVYECGTVRSLAKFNADTESKEIGLWAFTMGELTFASAPFEMFCQTGMAIREADKATTTFIVTHANGSNGYLASADVYDNLGYEVVAYPFAKGSAESAADKLISMINSNYN